MRIIISLIICAFALGVYAAALREPLVPYEVISPISTLETRQSGNLPTFNEWTCGRPTGGGGHDALKKVHSGFNRVFGSARLTMAPGQCYVGTCHSHFFAVCNTSGVKRTEDSGARDHARNADPGRGGSCRYLRYRETYIHYYFGTGEGNFAGQTDRRRC